MTILIVDDQSSVIDGLLSSIDFERLGLDTVLTAADADSHHKFARFAKRFGCGFDVGEFSFGNAAWKVEPTEEIVALTCAFFKFFYCVNSLLLQCVNLALVDFLTKSGEIRYLNLF